MSDFLTNLATRSLGMAPNLLRPQLPSLFESPKDSAPIQDEGESLSVYQELDQTGSSVPVTAHNPRQDDYRIRKSNGNSASRAERGSTETEHTRSGRQTIVSYEPAKQREASTHIQLKEPTIIEPIVSVVKGSENQEQIITPRAEEPVRLQIGNTDQTRPSREIGPPLIPAVPKMEPAPSSPQINHDSNADVSPSGHPPSIVRISIGRIEVRAATSPPAPVRSAIHTSPKMTLEEYLHSRNEGRR